jgi:hypothetical protein
VGLIALVANILLGAVISSYSIFNIVLNSTIIVFNALFVYLINVTELKDAFKISLSLFFSLLGITEYVLGFFSSQQLANNWYLIFIIIAIAFEAILLVITNITTKIVQ